MRTKTKPAAARDEEAERKEATINYCGGCRSVKLIGRAINRRNGENDRDGGRVP